MIPKLCDLIHKSIKNPEPALRQPVFGLEKEFSLGRINEEQFFAQAVKLTKIEGSSEILEEKVFAGLELSEGMAGILEELIENHKVEILSQYSTELTKKILKKTYLLPKFPEDRIRYTTEMHLPDLEQCLAAKYMCEGWIQRGESIWVDADPHRTMAFIRAGIDAIIFIDSTKLRREIALRGLLPRLGGE